MGQIHMRRANPFRALVAGITADELLLLREAVDEKRCSDEVGAGTLAEAARPIGRTRSARVAAPAALGGTTQEAAAEGPGAQVRPARAGRPRARDVARG